MRRFAVASLLAVFAAVSLFAQTAVQTHTQATATRAMTFADLQAMRRVSEPETQGPGSRALKAAYTSRGTDLGMHNTGIYAEVDT